MKIYVLIKVALKYFCEFIKIL